MITAARFDQPIDLGRELLLDKLPHGEAERLGRVFASIEPWSRYEAYGSAQMAKYFCGANAEAPRLALYRAEQIVGVIGLRLGWLRGPYLQFLGIVPGEQDKGLGGIALRWLLADAQRAGERNFWVCCSDFNVAARRFYAAHGFLEVTTLPGLVSDGQTEILLRKLLT